MVSFNYSVVYWLYLVNLLRKLLCCSFKLKILFYFYILRKGCVFVGYCYLLCNIFRIFVEKLRFRFLV